MASWPTLAGKDKNKMLRILDYAWHQAHSYRLHALPALFWYVALRRTNWNEMQRPTPKNFCGMIEPEDIDQEYLRQFDLALLHLDQWCDRVTFRALPFRRMRHLTDGIPQIIIMHGTPDDESNRKKMLRLIGDLPVVCNSRQAAAEWDGDEGHIDRHGCPQFRVIIHGYDVDEFWSDPLDKRAIEAVTICSGGKLSREYHGIPLIESMLRDVPLAWYGPGGNREWLGDYVAYREMLAQSLIYFSPTRRAPMPGARTEAMLSGCCIVTVPGHDVEDYVGDGQNGFIVSSFVEARDTLRMLLRDPETAWYVGQAGRETARMAFGKDRYVTDWLQVLEQVGVLDGIETETPQFVAIRPECIVTCAQ